MNYGKTRVIKKLAFSFVLLLNLVSGSWAFAGSYSVSGPGVTGQQTFVNNATTPQSYQYQATVFIEGSQNFEYYCGGPYNGGDIIYRYVDGWNDVPIFQRSSALYGTDYHHACAPSVIYNPYVGAYQLYYECSPRGFPYGNPQDQVEAFTQICMAVSWDKSNFSKIAFDSSGNIIYGPDNPTRIVWPVETYWQCGLYFSTYGTQIYFSQPNQPPCPYASGNTIGGGGLRHRRGGFPLSLWDWPSFSGYRADGSDPAV